MAAQKGRRACVRLSYTRHKKTALSDSRVKTANAMREYMESFVYTDCAHGNLDTISVVLDNSDSRFYKAWMPRKKDRMSASIVTQGWDSGSKKKRMRCGMFMVDTVRFTGVPDVCEIGAHIPRNILLPHSGKGQVMEKSNIKRDSAGDSRQI